MPTDPGRTRRADRAAEWLLLAISCLAPWAFGAVEAWALTAIDAAVILLALLRLGSGRIGPRAVRRPCLPEIALTGLALLGFAQSFGSAPAKPEPASAPESGSRPVGPTRVVGDPGPDVPLPARTISVLPEESRNVAWRLVSSWVVFRSVISLGGGTASLRRFGIAVVVNSCALSFFSMIQALTWNGRIYWLRASPQEGAWFAGGPFVCHSHLAAYLNIGLGFAFAALFRPRGRGPRLWSAYAAALIAVGVLASRSRSGVAASIGAFAVVLCFSPRLIRYSFAAAGVAALAGLMMLALPGGEVVDRLATLFDLNSRGYTSRFEIWGQAIEAWRAGPFFGSGLGSFAVAAAPFGVRDHGVSFARAENEYLDLLVEGGVVGLGIALAGLAGVAGLARMAVKADDPARGGRLVPGAVFGLAALAIQSLGDFALHIPAIAITATILAAHVCGVALGADARRGPATSARSRPFGGRLSGLALAASAISILLHDIPLLRAEFAMRGSDLPTPGTSSPALRPPPIPLEILECRRVALESMLRHRPDWAEGHIRLGLTLVAIYERTAVGLVEEATGDRGQAALAGDALWLRGLMHPSEGPPPATSAGLLEHDPVRRYLVPAARSYLEARRCGGRSALAHAGLAGLDFLLEGGDPTGAHLRRAVELAGADRRLLPYLAEVAVQDGNFPLAARCLEKMLEAGELGWEAIADRAAELFDAEEILRDVLPAGGRLPLLFATRLYGRAEDREARDRFLVEAIARLPADLGLAPAERLRAEALAWLAMGDRAKACDRLRWALGLDPSNGDWREDLGRWLLEADRADDAHREASIGLQLSPGHAGLGRLLGDAAEARARRDRAANGPL